MPGDSLNMNFNNKGVAANTFEAIVIGSGISGYMQVHGQTG